MQVLCFLSKETWFLDYFVVACANCVFLICGGQFDMVIWRYVGLDCFVVLGLVLLFSILSEENDFVSRPKFQKLHAALTDVSNAHLFLT